jgi:hypothetical protein
MTFRDKTETFVNDVQSIIFQTRRTFLSNANNNLGRVFHSLILNVNYSHEFLDQIIIKGKRKKRKKNYPDKERKKMERKKERGRKEGSKFLHCH